MKFVKLYKDPNYGFGMVITCGNTYDTVLHGAFVESTFPGSPAALNGNVAPGDQIMSVNGTDVQNDHFLTVVDLLQCSTNSVDLVIAKSNKITSDLSSFIKKEISEKPFSKSKAWIVGNEKSKITMPAVVKVEVNANDIPVPKPRKKWLEQQVQSNFCEPDLTLNHSSNVNLDKNHNKDSDRVSMTRDNIPDIIASQMKHLVTSPISDLLDMGDGGTESELYHLKDVDENVLLPGEVFHVVLDKKGGSLGLNIYQGTESPCTEQRHIYIHSVIPNGAADLDGRIKPGDKLLEVNGVLLENLSYQEVVTKLRESPQVAHLVLEKGSLIETVESEIMPKSNDYYSKSCLEKVMLDEEKPAVDSSTSVPVINCGDINQTDIEVKRKERATSVDACLTTLKNSDLEDQISYSSLPSVPNEFHFTINGAKDIDSSLLPNENDEKTRKEGYQFKCATGKTDCNMPNCTSSPSYPMQNINSALRFRSPLTSYNSTPNLAENSDEEDKNEANGLLYRNRSTECLVTPHFLKPHQALLDFYQNYSYLRGSSSNFHQIPAIPIRKKKLKKLEDIYNYCNSDNCFEIRILKSSRGLGLSIYGGSDAFGRDLFSQLIRIRKLYPLQPALECGKLLPGDVILEVNGTSMVGLTNTEALEVLRCAPTEVILKVFRPSKSLIPSFSTFKGAIWPFFDSSSSSASSSLSRTDANTYNVETGEFEVILIKRGGSLGFTISRNESAVENPQEGIYVKALVREPAVSDGRIQPGDKILQVNGTPISALSHSDAIEFLRNTPNTVTLKLFRNDVPTTPGYLEEEYSITKPLRWEAVGFLNDRMKNRDSSDEGGCTPKRRIKRKLDRISNAPSNSSTESDSSNSLSSGQEHIIEEESPDASETMNLEGMGLQRNQRPKSLDILNGSDRKRCADEENFHRQSSVMCSNAETKTEEDGEDNSSKKAGKTLLKWRGSTLPHSEEADMPDGNQDEFNNHDSITNETVASVESTSDDEKPVPFPRTTSCTSGWVQTVIQVDLDRGWHGRLGFSLTDPPPPSPEATSENSLMPKAAAVKAVHPSSLADRDGRIKVGDRLLEINRECLLNKSAQEVIDILRKTRGVIKMVFMRLVKQT